MIAVVLNAVLPVCLLVLLGALLCYFQFLPASFFTQLNRLGFWLLLPSLLFSTLASSPVRVSGAGLKIGLVLCLSATTIIAVAWLTARLMHLPGASARALMQASMRGNLAYTALPVLIYTFGQESANAATAVLALAPTIPFYNFCAVLILTPGLEQKTQPQVWSSVTQVLRNPLIIGCLLGILVLESGLTLPPAAMRTVASLGHAALPCALLALGAGLTPRVLRHTLRPALAATLLKLIGAPLLGFLWARMMGLSGHALLIALLYLATPCAVTSYVMADQMNADSELAASAIALSTLLCLPVMIAILLLCQ